MRRQGENRRPSRPRCGGRGETEHEETLTVTIPDGLEEGTALRIPGHGLPSPEPGGPPGDLFVVVRNIPDPRCQRDGTVSLSVPAGNQPDSVLRLRGKGLPQFGGSHGDLYVRIKLQIPRHLSTRENELNRQLRDLPP